MIEPRQGTKEWHILAYLKAGNTITKAEAMTTSDDRMRTVSLNTAIGNLRAKGWDIKTEMIPREDAQSYAMYYLSGAGSWLDKRVKL